MFDELESAQAAEPRRSGFCSGRSGWDCLGVGDLGCRDDPGIDSGSLSVLWFLQPDCLVGEGQVATSRSAWG